MTIAVTPRLNKGGYSLSSTHIWSSASRRRPVGQAHETRGECGPILGAGRHRWEQCPLTAAQWFTPSGCRYGWYTWMTIGFWICQRKEETISHICCSFVRSKGHLPMKYQSILFLKPFPPDSTAPRLTSSTRRHFEGVLDAFSTTRVYSLNW